MRKYKPGVSKLQKYIKPLFGTGVRKMYEDEINQKLKKLSRKLCNKRSRKSKNKYLSFLYGSEP
jgi:hypothetical protein